jgi:hypothetical protein
MCRKALSLSVSLKSIVMEPAVNVRSVVVSYCPAHKRMRLVSFAKGQKALKSTTYSMNVELCSRGLKLLKADNAA